MGGGRSPLSFPPASTPRDPAVSGVFTGERECGNKRTFHAQLKLNRMKHLKLFCVKFISPFGRIQFCIYSFVSLQSFLILPAVAVNCINCCFYFDICKLIYLLVFQLIEIVLHYCAFLLK